MPVPAGLDQHRLAGDVEALERVRIDRHRAGADDEAGQRGKLSRSKRGEIGAVRIAMEGRVEIGAGIGDHVDPADLEGRAVVVELRR